MITVEELIDSHPNVSTEERNKLVEDWIETYYQERDKYPHSYQLSKLSDWILSDTLKDVSRSKVQREEFPILSRPQIERRYRELSLESDIVDVLNIKRKSHQPTKKRDSKNNEY